VDGVSWLRWGLKRAGASGQGLNPLCGMAFQGAETPAHPVEQARARAKEAADSRRE